MRSTAVEKLGALGSNLTALAGFFAPFGTTFRESRRAVQAFALKMLLLPCALSAGRRSSPANAGAMKNAYRLEDWQKLPCLPVTSAS